MAKSAASKAEDGNKQAAENRLYAGTINARTNKSLIGHPRNVIKRFLQLCSTASGCTDVAALERDVEAFISEDLAHLHLALEGKALEIRVAQEGVRHLQQCQQDLQGQVQEVDARIKESQAELERSKVYRQQQEECEVLKESIMTLPARADTEREIAQVRAETEELERESAQLDSDIELRRKQFAHLSVVLQNLTASIRERAEPAHDGGTMDVDA